MAAGRKGEAFTLVELLVVISIIALLTAILVPALQRARGEARQLWCMTTLRTFSLAHKQYLAETGKYLPHTSYDPYTPWFNNDSFRRSIGLRILTRDEKERRITATGEWKPNVTKKFICPAASYALDNPEDRFYPIDRSYGVNIDGDYLARKSGAGDLYDKEGWVKRPSEKLFMVDALDWWTGYAFCDSNDYFANGENWLGFETYGMTAYRHYGRADVLYWDGHCGRLSAEEIDGNPDLWNPLE